MDNERNTKQLIIAGLCALAVAFIPNWEGKLNQFHQTQVLGKSQTKVSDITAAPELVTYQENPNITAKSALAYDFKSGSILFTLNFDEKLPIASLTKLMSALVVKDSNKLESIIDVKEEDIKVIGPNTGLVAGEKVKASDLLIAMLVSSHNDSTQVLTRHVGGTEEQFVKMMNNKARFIGLENTNFTNPVGFDDINHYSTANDLTLILRNFLSDSELAEIVQTRDYEIKPLNLNFTHKIKTTNKLLLEDETVVGVKTGYTTEAKGNLVIRSVEGNSDVVTIVLGSDDREADTRKILDWIRTVYRW